MDTYLWRTFIEIWGKSWSVQLSLVYRKDANAFQQHQTCKVRDQVDKYFTVSPPDAYVTHLCHYDSTPLQYICLCLQLWRSGGFLNLKKRSEDETSDLVLQTVRINNCNSFKEINMHNCLKPALQYTALGWE